MQLKDEDASEAKADVLEAMVQGASAEVSEGAVETEWVKEPFQVKMAVSRVVSRAVRQAAAVIQEYRKEAVAAQVVLLAITPAASGTALATKMEMLLAVSGVPETDQGLVGASEKVDRAWRTVIMDKEASVQDKETKVLEVRVVRVVPAVLVVPSDMGMEMPLAMEMVMVRGAQAPKTVAVLDIGMATETVIPTATEMGTATEIPVAMATPMEMVIPMNMEIMASAMG